MEGKPHLQKDRQNEKAADYIPDERTRCTNTSMLELLKMDYKISVNTFKGINKKLKKKSHSKYLCSKYIPDTVTGTLLRLNP